MMNLAGEGPGALQLEAILRNDIGSNAVETHAGQGGSLPCDGLRCGFTHACQSNQDGRNPRGA